MSDEHLPGAVFARPWSVFYFFSLDGVDVAILRDALEALAENEGSSEICVFSPDTKLGFVFDTTNFDEDGLSLAIAAALYAHAAAESEPQSNLELVSLRLVCIGEREKWCVYIDGGASVGIVALLESTTTDSAIAIVRDKLQCATLKEIFGKGIDGPRPFSLMDSSWRTQLLRTYERATFDAGIRFDFDHVDRPLRRVRHQNWLAICLGGVLMVAVVTLVLPIPLRVVTTDSARFMFWRAAMLATLLPLWVTYRLTAYRTLTEIRHVCVSLLIAYVSGIVAYGVIPLAYDDPYQRVIYGAGSLSRGVLFLLAAPFLTGCCHILGSLAWISDRIARETFRRF